MKKIKFILITVLLFIVAVFGLSEAAKNFSAIAAGQSSGDTSSAKAYAFTGQSALIFSEARTKDLVLRAGMPSVITKAPNVNITFTNLTGSETFPTQTVTVQVRVESTNGYNINKVRYAVAEGQNADFGDQIDYTVTPSTAVMFTQEINFSKGQSVNKVYVYAQDDSTNVFGNDTQIIVNTAGSLGDVSFISPDSVSGFTTLNPLIKTTMFSLGVSSATVRLYSGPAASGDPIYDVQVTTEIVNEAGQIEYYNSELMPDNENLNPNSQYTLAVYFDNTYPSPITITFTALSGGVANILTYPSPFNPNNNQKIKIRYLLAQSGQVSINLYNKAGKIVRKLINSAERSAGSNEEEWDGRNYAGEILATGPYICEIITKGADGESRRYTALAIVGK
ncbi:MAG: FlgD immunoglobulin-like domain containing protein [Endomicrobiaceae bacterium]|nr:FlgD immunoglobulin-like domain containing protein [Endomicrobiaceae bacterium]